MAAMFSVDLIELVGSVTVSAPLFNREREQVVFHHDIHPGKYPVISYVKT